MASTPSPVDRAIEAAGGADAFVQQLGISLRTLYYWRADGIPPFRLRRVSQVTGIPASELRPDLFTTDAA